MKCKLIMEVNEPALVAAAASVVAAFDLFPRHSLQLHHLDPEDPTVYRKNILYNLIIFTFRQLQDGKLFSFNNFFYRGIRFKRSSSTNISDRRLSDSAIVLFPATYGLTVVGCVIVLGTAIVCVSNVVPWIGI